MTREEDFKEEGRIAVNKYARELGDYIFGVGSMVEMFVLGANYADQHPRKGLWDAEKVYKVLKDYMFKERFFDNRITRTAMIDNVVCNLIKAMEE